MRQLLTVVLIAGFLAFLTGCAKTENSAENLPHATVALRDGSTYKGTIVKSSPSEITLVSDDKSTHTFDMKNVKSVDYAEPSAVQNAAADGAGRAAPAAQTSRPSAAAHYHPAESRISTKSYELPTGTKVSVRTDENIDSSKAVAGQTFAADVSNDVLDANGAVVIPRGSNAKIVIRSATQAGRVQGSSDLVLDLQSVSVGGRLYRLSTASVTQKGRAGLGKNKRTAEYVGGGAAVGAVIGAIAGQGKGAAIGAASGAAAGAATQVLTRGGAIRVPPETILTFQLAEPLRVSPARR